MSRAARTTGILAAAGLALSASACTVLSTAETDAIRARASGAFDGAARLAQVWPVRAMQALDARRLPLVRLRGGDVDALARSHGHRPGDGSAATFFVEGDGVVRAIDAGPRGRISLDTSAGPAILQTGPVVSGTAIRDALPFVDFDDFPDQIRFAEFGMALTDRALVPMRPAIAALRPGDRVRFAGAVSIAERAAPLIVTPMRLQRIAPVAEASR